MGGFGYMPGFARNMAHVIFDMFYVSLSLYRAFTFKQNVIWMGDCILMCVFHSNLRSDE